MLSFMHRFAVLEQGICSTIRSKFEQYNNKGQERYRYNGYDNKIGSIVVEEAENTADRLRIW
jgi:hypothetical protein